VFADPLAAMLEDTLDPERAILVSQSDKRRVLLIVFIEVSEDTIRIISAGRATSHKRRRYEEGDWQESSRAVPRIAARDARSQFRQGEGPSQPLRAPHCEGGISIHAGRGRPRKGTETGPTIPRSVRFPAKVWRHLARRAKAEGMPLHAAIRAAVMAWINT